jgi:hypothetical protein
MIKSLTFFAVIVGFVSIAYFITSPVGHEKEQVIQTVSPQRLDSMLPSVAIYTTQDSQFVDWFPKFAVGDTIVFK